MAIKINYDVAIKDSHMLHDDEGQEVRRRYITEATYTYQVGLIFSNYAPWIKEFEFNLTDSEEHKHEVIDKIGEMVKKGILIESGLMDRKDIGVSFPVRTDLFSK